LARNQLSLEKPLNNNPFSPPRLLTNPHLQTLWPNLLRSGKALATLSITTERLDLPDGDFIDLVWSDKQKNTSIVVILHGLVGSLRSHYAANIMRAMAARGYRSVFMHFRGCSGEPNRLPRSYHSGDTGDVAHLVKTIRLREPHTPIGVVGVSLGGNVLLKWLGECGLQSPVQAAVAVSVPFQLDRAVAKMQTGVSRFYQYYLLRDLIRYTKRKFKHRTAPFDLDKLKQVKNLYAFDELVTAPLHGFDSADHYYRTCSSRQFLRTIETPTLILHSRDDPLMPPDVIPSPTEVSQKITLQISPHGGHVGFVAKNPATGRISSQIGERSAAFLCDYL
jgi:predicted alpha/beta-fold hydrolase